MNEHDILDPSVRARAIEKATKKSKFLRDRELSDIRKVIREPEGRRFYWRVLSDAGIFRNSFTGNSTTFYNEGQRSIGLGLLEDLLEADKLAFSKMQLEQYSEAKKQEDK